MSYKAGWVKLTQWEHWPTPVYYLPLLPFFLMRSIKARHPLHYTVTNPSILYSGNGTESKFTTLSLLPDRLTPKGMLIDKEVSFKLVMQRILQMKLTFPLIAKPDIGFRGYLVKKINNEQELLSYLKRVNEPVIIQEFIPYENELGIFYYRIPGQSEGQISSVTIKRFIRVTADGISTLSDLIKKNKRAFIYYDLFKRIHQANMEKVYKKGKTITLSVIGNHSKGTQFINGNHLISPELVKFSDNICQNIKGWYYGRLDIKYSCFDKMLQGKDFKVLEINGIISEPTHIYDASHKNASFLKALKSINEHWRIMHKIALINHKQKGVPYPKIWPYIKNMIWLKSYSKKLKELNNQEF